MEEALSIEKGYNANATVQMINLIFSLLLIVWSVLFQETWKRKCNHTSLEWGTNDYKPELEDRAEFEGTIQ